MEYKLTGKTVLFEKETLAEATGPAGERLFILSKDVDAMLPKLNYVCVIDEMVAYKEDAELLDERDGFMIDLQNEREALDEKETLFLEDWNRRYQLFKAKAGS